MKVIAVVVLAAAFAAQARAGDFDCQKHPAKQATRIGAFTFKQVCHNSGKGDHEHSVSYPRIVSAGPAAAKWNALVAKTATSLLGDDDFDISDVSYDIGAPSAKLISVHFDLYDNTGGAAHPAVGQSGLTMTMPSVTPLRASDLFIVTPQWKTFMAKQLAAAFTALAGMSTGDAGIANDTLTGQATDPKYWFIDSKGLTIATGDLVSVPNSDIRAAIPWAALRPYLAANAPVP